MGAGFAGGPMIIPRLYARYRAVCADGRYRSARITGWPVGGAYVPASVKVGGRTVAGIVWKDRGGRLYFAVDRAKVNGRALPAWGGANERME